MERGKEKGPEMYEEGEEEGNNDDTTVVMHYKTITVMPKWRTDTFGRS